MMRVSNPHKSLPWIVAVLGLGACSHEAIHEPLAWFDLEDPDWLAKLPRERFDAVFMPRILPWIEMATADEVHGAIAGDLASRGGGG